jgi:iron complex transport system ATP-binding protein
VKGVIMLDIQSLSAAYNHRAILSEISMSIQAGEILAVIGPNGVGKSTLIRVISGVLPARSGSVRVADQELINLSPMQRARYMAVVPQARELPAAYTVYQTVLLGRTPYLNWLGHPGKADRELVYHALELTQITELAERRIGELSGGEQQRVLLARALAQDAPILLLDEPTTHLDLEHQSSLLNLISELALHKKLAILMALHDLNAAGQYANRVALLLKGQLYALGSPSEVLTSENLSSAYNLSVKVVPHPDYDSPLIIPDGREKVPVLNK